MENDGESPEIARRNALARLITANKLGLKKDCLGKHLTDDFWMQAIPVADAILVIINN